MVIILNTEYGELEVAYSMKFDYLPYHYHNTDSYWNGDGIRLGSDFLLNFFVYVRSGDGISVKSIVTNFRLC